MAKKPTEPKLKVKLAFDKTTGDLEMIFPPEARDANGDVPITADLAHSVLDAIHDMAKKMKVKI